LGQQPPSPSGGPAPASKAPPGCFVAVVAVTALIGLGFLATILAILEPGDEPTPAEPVGPGATGTTTVAPGRDGGGLPPSLRGLGNATGTPFRAGGEWTMRWSFDCSGVRGGDGTFLADPDGPGPAPGVGRRGRRGQGAERYRYQFCERL
jgi:hypothetical protein